MLPPLSSYERIAFAIQSPNPYAQRPSPYKPDRIKKPDVKHYQQPSLVGVWMSTDKAPIIKLQYDRKVHTAACRKSDLKTVMKRKCDEMLQYLKASNPNEFQRLLDLDKRKFSVEMNKLIRSSNRL
jgi:hypothetical protein